MRTLRRAVLALLVSSPAGCGAGRPAEEAALAPRAPARERLPAFVVTTPRTRLVGGADRKTVAIPKARVPLRIVEDGAAPPGLVAVAIDGGIALTALASRDELGVLVCEGGPVGAHLYAGDRNLIVLGGARPGGRFSVRGDVVLPSDEPADKPAFLRLRTLRLEGEIEERRLCSARPAARHAGTAEDPTFVHLAGELDEEDFPRTTAWVEVPAREPVRLLASPAGEVLATLPVSDGTRLLPSFREDGDARLVAAGSGPYVLGWVRGARPAPPRERTVGGLLGAMGKRTAPFALYRRELAKLPLHELAAGTRIDAGVAARATLVRAGFARVGETAFARTFVDAAVDDDVLVSGWIDTAALGAKLPE